MSGERKEFHKKAEDEACIEVQYFRQAFGRAGIQKEHLEALECLANREYAAIKRHRIHTPPGEPKVYSIEYSYEGRMLVTKRKKDGKTYWLVLEDLPTHDYKNAHFLRPGVLANFLKYDDVLTAAEEVEPEEKEEKKPKAKPTTKKAVVSRPVEFFNGKILEYNSNQKKALPAKLPIIIEGHAGSGKTFIAQGLLEILSQEMEDQVIYLAENQDLVDKMKKQWGDKPIKSADDNKAKFMTFRQLAQMVDSRLADLTDDDFVGVDQFEEWSADQCKDNGYFKTLRRLIKKGSAEEALLNELLANKHKLYEEFRILSGYGEAAYMKLGEDENHFHDEKQKEWLLQLYKRYQEHLTSAGQCDLAFYPLNNDKEVKIGAIVVDEALDLSYGQVGRLIKISNRKICFCNGSLQHLKDRKPNRVYQKKLIGQIATLIPLPQVLRFSKEVSKVAENIGDIRTILHRGALTKDEILDADAVEDQSVKGDVYLQEDISQEALKKMIANYKLSDVAIVTHPEFVDEANKIFGEKLVYNMEEIKGLEFPVVMVYRPLDLDQLKDANVKIAEQLQKETGKKVNLPKAGEAEDKYDLTCNNIYTAVTRTTGDLLIAQARNRRNESLVAKLVSGVKLKTKKQEGEVAQAAPVESAADWYKRAVYVYENGDHKRAAEIRNTELDETYRKKFDELVESDRRKHEELQKESEKKEPAQSAAPQPSAASPQITSRRKKEKTTPKTEQPAATLKTQPPAPTPAVVTSRTVKAGPAKKQHLKLPNKFNVKNLTALFKEEGVAEFLFTEDSHGASPVRKIFADEGMMGVLCKTFEMQPTLFQKLPLKYLYSKKLNYSANIENGGREPLTITVSGNLMTYFSMNSGLAKFLCDWACSVDGDELKEFVRQLTTECTISDYKKLSKSTIFMHFVTRETSIQFLTNLRAKKPDVSRFITSAHLHKDIVDYDINRSFTPFKYLSRSKIGCQFLNEVFSCNPELMSEMPAEALFSEFYLTTTQCTTVFTNLLQFREGQQLLLKILGHNRLLLEQITPELLTHSFPTLLSTQVARLRGCEQAGISGQNCPNYINLLRLNDFKFVLEKLFKIDSFAREFVDHYLFTSIVNGDRKIFNVSFDVFDETIRRRHYDGGDLFLQLLEKYPDLMLMTEGQNLFEENDTDESVFHLLSIDIPYHTYLLELFKTKPRLLEFITYYEFMKINNRTENKSPFHVFSTTEAGRALLKLILTMRADIRRSLSDIIRGYVSIQHSIERLLKNNAIITLKTTLDVLQQTEDGKEILALIEQDKTPQELKYTHQVKLFPPSTADDAAAPQPSSENVSGLEKPSS